MPRYYKRFWDESDGTLHEGWGNATFYFEVNDDRYASRQIEVYENGSALKYDDELVFDEYGGLAVPPFEEEEYAEFEISASHFERVWSSTKPFNRRRWFAKRSIFARSSLGTSVRRIATLVFGAVPAMWLLFIGSELLFFELRRAVGRDGALGVLDQGFELLLGFGWLILGALGVIGLWRVSIQTHFVSRANFYLLAAGVLAIWPSIVRILALWSIAYPDPILGQVWPVFLLVLVAPFVTALFYLVAMVVLYARGRDG